MAESVLNEKGSKLKPHEGSRYSHRKDLKRNTGLILSVVMIALTAYVLNLQEHNSHILAHSTDMALTSSAQQSADYRAYVRKYKETKVQLEETTRKLEEVNRQLDTVSAELTLTKGMLSQTRNMLTQAQTENARLKEDISSIDTQQENIPQLESRITALKEKNTQVTSELDGLKNQLRAFEADFANMEEGKSLITLFQSKIKLVKSRMRYLKQEAYFARIAAQKERDRAEAINGNNGYLVRDGQIKKTNGKPFAIDVKIIP